MRKTRKVKRPVWQCQHGKCKRMHEWGGKFCWQHAKRNRSGQRTTK